MMPQDILEYLHSVKYRDGLNVTVSTIRETLSNIKKDAVAEGDQNTAKNVWIHEQILKSQELYLKAYSLLIKHKYYEGWCVLEKCELSLNDLRRHYDYLTDNSYSLGFIEKHVERYQSIFPYKIFISPEILEKEIKCTICNQKISIRKPCGHVVGEIYDGEMCCREVTDCEFIATAFVKSPLQKYSVVFTSDPKTGKSVDNYNYSIIKYVVERLHSPFDEWKPSWTRRRHPHSKFNGIGRNDKCPCGSDKKYKKCCLLEDGVLMPHVVIKFSVEPPRDLQTIEYSY